ncbi:MAG TPA: GTPase ObgE [Patescibacteria group bacterium]|nr:GTPase ObgE [Patescibacteria group bacterium]
MFIDSAKIYVKAGDGGRGCQSMYRDKYTRRGIPDGGDGGKGADIIVRADRNLDTLLDFKYNRHFTGKHGAHGSGKDQKGKDGTAIIIRVPCGTAVKDVATNCLLRDLDQDGQELVVARGGEGGIGNMHHRAATAGTPGEDRWLLLDLKVMADVGVVGFPNAGKSTLVSSVSNAHPEVAAYPFTTKFPVLGVVACGERTFVLADIPGLIEGASHGKGLGDKFLRHLERTKILVHLVDMAGSQGRDPVEDYKAINQELKFYSSQVYKKPQVIAANKMDLEASSANLARFKKAVKKKVYPISALNKKGLEELVAAISKKL